MLATWDAGEPNVYCLGFMLSSDWISTIRRQLTPVFDKPAFSRFSQNCEPRFVVEIFGKIVKRQVCQKRGWVADGWFRQTHRRAIIILWCRVPFQHATTNIFKTSARLSFISNIAHSVIACSPEFDRHIAGVIGMLSSSCDVDGHTGMPSSLWFISSSCGLGRYAHRHAIIILWPKLWVLQTHRRAMFIFDFDNHIEVI